VVAKRSPNLITGHQYYNNNNNSDLRVVNAGTPVVLVVRSPDLPRPSFGRVTTVTAVRVGHGQLSTLQVFPLSRLQRSRSQRKLHCLLHEPQTVHADIPELSITISNSRRTNSQGFNTADSGPPPTSSAHVTGRLPDTNVNMVGVPNCNAEWTCRKTATWVCFSETMVSTCQSTRRNNTEQHWRDVFSLK
jgi:hypothetical protein